VAVGAVADYDDGDTMRREIRLPLGKEIDMNLRRCVPALALTLGLLPTAPAQPPTAAKPAVRVVRYDALSSFITQQRGKVLVLDFWADYCIPCKREFPKLVAMHGKYAKDGLTAVSVSVDDMGEDGAKDKVLQFLDKQKATFTNLILDEKPELWQGKLKIDGPPLVMVYARDGRLEQRYPNEKDKEVDYAVIEKLVAELLKK
jgi:thiol-disulfide isomerase/thioredoxin